VQRAESGHLPAGNSNGKLDPDPSPAGSVETLGQRQQSGAALCATQLTRQRAQVLSRIIATGFGVFSVACLFSVSGPGKQNKSCDDRAHRNGYIRVRKRLKKRICLSRRLED
jgi:hypothetical protein